MEIIDSFLNKLLIFSNKYLVYLKILKFGIILYKFIKSKCFKFWFKFSSTLEFDSCTLFPVVLILLDDFGNTLEKILKKILSILLPSSQFIKHKKLGDWLELLLLYTEECLNIIFILSKLIINKEHISFLNKKLFIKFNCNILLISG